MLCVIEIHPGATRSNMWHADDNCNRISRGRIEKFNCACTCSGACATLDVSHNGDFQFPRENSSFLGEGNIFENLNRY